MNGLYRYKFLSQDTKVKRVEFCTSGTGSHTVKEVNPKIMVSLYIASGNTSDLYKMPSIY